MAPGRVVLDPAGRGALCAPCGAYWPDPTRAALCHPTPVIPGAAMRPSRPPYVPQDARYVPFTPHTYGVDRTRWYRRAIVVGIVLIVLALMAGAAIAAQPSFPGPAVTPTTYGPPASTGGPVITR